MADIEQLVEKFRAKLVAAQELERYKNEVVNPLVSKIFIEDFYKVFQNLADEINDKVGSKVISSQLEGKNRFIVEGQYHRVYFQKGKIDVLDGTVSVNIIPIYVWKGVTKHLGPISLFLNPSNEEINWDIPLGNVSEYSKDLFSKLVDDEDFSM